MEKSHQNCSPRANTRFPKNDVVWSCRISLGLVHIGQRHNAFHILNKVLPDRHSVRVPSRGLVEAINDRLHNIGLRPIDARE